jgi:hypothetical protein
MTRRAEHKATKTFAGLDVSLKETAIRIVDDTSKVVSERVWYRRRHYQSSHSRQVILEVEAFLFRLCAAGDKA